ncbi:hypothetical protein STEG23_029665, partial [Scotinomys teguina]
KVQSSHVYQPVIGYPVAARLDTSSPIKLLGEVSLMTVGLGNDLCPSLSKCHVILVVTQPASIVPENTMQAAKGGKQLNSAAQMQHLGTMTISSMTSNIHHVAVLQLFTHPLLRDIFVITNKDLINIHEQVCVDINFQISWINTWEQNGWIIRFQRSGITVFCHCVCNVFRLIMVKLYGLKLAKESTIQGMEPNMDLYCNASHPVPVGSEYLEDIEHMLWKLTLIF